MSYFDTILNMYFGYLNMPTNVFGNSLNNFYSKIDISLFVQRLCLRTIYIESNIEEYIDIRNRFRIKI